MRAWTGSRAEGQAFRHCSRAQAIWKSASSEEYQQAHLDAVMCEQIAEGLGSAEIDTGTGGYLAPGAFLDAGLKQQAAFDMAALEKAIGRDLTDAQRTTLMEFQHQANRWTYIGSGMDHPRFLETLQKLSTECRAMIQNAAPTFC